MDMKEYQKLAARTINYNLTNKQQIRHALHGMVGEIGEIHSIYQKKYQGHEFDKDTDTHLKKEVGDLLWFIGEFLTANGWSLDEVAEMNIEKLKARYPDGFRTEQSLHRKDGDI